jgi:putative ABC transport system permease protein
MFFKLAFKNITRNRRRTIITEIAIVVGIIIIIFLGGFLEAMSTGWADQMISGSTGHLQIINKHYFENQKTRPLRSTIEDFKQLAERIEQLDAVESTTPSLSFGGLIGNGENSTTFFGYGNLRDEVIETLPRQAELLREGRLPDGGNIYEGAIGHGLAKQLGVTLGDVLLIVSKTIDGQMNATDLEIVGLVGTGEVVIDDNLVIADYRNVAGLLDMEGKASELIVRLTDNDLLSDAYVEISDVLKKEFPKLDTFPWTEVYKEFGQVMTMFGGIALIVGLIIFFLVAVGIVNTMVMSIFERTREVGTVMAIGTERRQVLKLFLLEGLAIGIVGAVLGVVLGIAVTLLFNKIGVPMPPPPGMTEGYTIHPVITLDNIVGAVLLAVGMSTLASLYPAVLASRMDPVEALRQR